jgi:putative membrane protein
MWFINLLKGMIMGIANVIPGVSGGTLALITGIYEKMINAITTLFKKFKENVLFLLPIGIGMVLAIYGGSKVIPPCLEKFPLATVLFFAGLILGGIPMLFKKINKHLRNYTNYIVFVIIFAALLCYTFLVSGSGNVDLTNLEIIDYIKLVLVGIVAAATMIVPGISGSMTLMVLGYYEGIYETVGNITDFSEFGHNMKILIPFGIGVVIGIFLIAKIIDFLLAKFEIKTYFGIFGFIFASLIIMFVKNVIGFNIIELIIGLVLLVIGFFISYFIANYQKKEKVENIE